jgi:thiamine biosynthesis lipoprotein
MKTFKTPTLFYAVLCAAAFTAACKNQRVTPVIYTGYVQGTTYNIRYYGGSDSLAIFRQIDSVFLLMNQTASLYDSGSMINRVNNNEDIEVNAIFATLTARSLEIAAETGGAFDPTVGPLVRAWGFYRKKGMDLPAGAVDSLRRLTGFQQVTMEGNRVVRKFPEIRLDFNAIAQGFTVDLVAGLFEKHGVTSYLVEIGGEVRAAGTKAGDVPWIVGIERPSENDSAEQVVQQRISLNGMSAATSGNYRKFFIRGGRKYSHTIDPATGYPVQHNLLSVTVIAGDCMTADAYATACMVMGVERSLVFLKAHPGTEAYFIYHDASGNMAFASTPGFDRYLALTP